MRWRREYWAAIAWALFATWLLAWSPDVLGTAWYLVRCLALLVAGFVVLRRGRTWLRWVAGAVSVVGAVLVLAVALSLAIGGGEGDLVAGLMAAHWLAGLGLGYFARRATPGAGVAPESEALWSPPAGFAGDPEGGEFAVREATRDEILEETRARGIAPAGFASPEFAEELEDAEIEHALEQRKKGGGKLH